jgi:hypothetical protein
MGVRVCVFFWGVCVCVCVCVCTYLDVDLQAAWAQDGGIDQVLSIGHACVCVCVRVCVCVCV